MSRSTTITSMWRRTWPTLTSLQIDTGGDLNEFQDGGREPEHAAFCHVEHRLPS